MSIKPSFSHISQSVVRKLHFMFVCFISKLAEIDHDARDEALRRKLFQTVANTSEYVEFGTEILLDSPAPRTPDMVCPSIPHSRFDFILVQYQFPASENLNPK